jgi:hypothetical protein
VEVHHLDGVTNWDELFRVVRDFLLCDPANMETLCEKCHKEETGKLIQELDDIVPP